MGETAADESGSPPLKIPTMKKLGELKVTVPLGLVAMIVTLAFKADNVTVGYLDDFFVTKAEAQTLSSKFSVLEDKVEGLSDRIDSQRVKQIEQEIFDRRVQACMADGPLRTLLQNQITALVGEWRTLTKSSGDPPTLVRCEDLG